MYSALRDYERLSNRGIAIVWTIPTRTGPGIVIQNVQHEVKEASSGEAVVNTFSEAFLMNKTSTRQDRFEFPLRYVSACAKPWRAQIHATAFFVACTDSLTTPTKLAKTLGFKKGANAIAGSLYAMSHHFAWTPSLRAQCSVSFTGPEVLRTVGFEFDPSFCAGCDRVIFTELLFARAKNAKLGVAKARADRPAVMYHELVDLVSDDSESKDDGPSA